MPKPVESFRAFKLLFDKYPYVDTPIGAVKLGDNQWEKLTARERLLFSGMVRPTLENPAYIVEEPDKSVVFVKSFQNSKDKTKLFVSVTREFDGVRVSFSNHMKGENKVVAMIEGGKLLNETRPDERTPNQVSPQQLDQRAIGLDSKIAPGSGGVKNSRSRLFSSASPASIPPSSWSGTTRSRCIRDMPNGLGA